MTELKMTKHIDDISYIVPVIWNNKLINIKHINDKYTITLLKEDMNSFIEIGLLYTDLTNVGVTVKINISKDILAKHKDEYIPKKDFFYSGIFFTYENGSWYKGTNCIAKNNIKFNDFIYKVIINSINLANK